MTDFDRQLLESALEWWRDAGVDTAVQDEPRDWFAPPPGRVVASPRADSIDAGALPEDWVAFLAWRAGEHSPEAGWDGMHIAATGPRYAAVMVLVDTPNREDCIAGSLLTGEAGALFDRMLTAVKLSRETVHLVSVCGKRQIHGRIDPGVAERLGAVARHHVRIAAPKRLLLMGDAASRAVLGMNVMSARGRLHEVVHKDGTALAVASFHPRLLLERPAQKREAWADLKLLMQGLG